MTTDTYVPGAWNFMCDRCGRKFKSLEGKKTWDGLYVCSSHGCFETRQPQDFAKGIAEKPTPPWTRPVQEDVFTPVCSPNGQTAYPSTMIPGCVIPSYISPLYDPTPIP